MGFMTTLVIHSILYMIEIHPSKLYPYSLGGGGRDIHKRVLNLCHKWATKGRTLVSGKL